MSQENVEFVKGLFAASGTTDKQALLTGLPEFKEFYDQAAAVEAAGLSAGP